MPLASLRYRSARFDDERLNQKVQIATLKNEGASDEALILSFCSSHFRLLNLAQGHAEQQRREAQGN